MRVSPTATVPLMVASLVAAVEERWRLPLKMMKPLPNDHALVMVPAQGTGRTAGVGQWRAGHVKDSYLVGCAGNWQCNKSAHCC